jgi:hypothetical protein
MPSRNWTFTFAPTANGVAGVIEPTFKVEFKPPPAGYDGKRGNRKPSLV